MELSPDIAGQEPKQVRIVSKNSRLQLKFPWWEGSLGRSHTTVTTLSEVQPLNQPWRWPQSPPFNSLLITLSFRELGKRTNGRGVDVLPDRRLLSSEPMWPTCPGTQQKNKNGLFPKVLNGQVPLFSSHGAIHTLIAVALKRGENGQP